MNETYKVKRLADEIEEASRRAGIAAHKAIFDKAQDAFDVETREGSRAGIAVAITAVTQLYLAIMETAGESKNERSLAVGMFDKVIAPTMARIKAAGK